MTVTIFGATGMVGKQLMVHAFSRGWKVKAFGRQVINLIDKGLQDENFTAIKGYVFDIKEVGIAIEGSDAVLSALGGKIDGTDTTRSLGMKNIISQMEKHGPKRIVALGGMGVLGSSKHGIPLFEQEGFPEEYVPVSKEHYKAYQYLVESSLDWTFFCSPDIIEAEADGAFEQVSEAAAANVEIKAGNLALAMINAVEKGSFIKQRVGIGDGIEEE
jgi:hypothetical protein